MSFRVTEEHVASARATTMAHVLAAHADQPSPRAQSAPAGLAASQLDSVSMANQRDGPNSLDYPIGVGAFTGHTRGGDGEPISFGPGTYHNVFDTDQDEAPAVAGNGTAGNYTVRGAPAPLRGNGKHIRRTPRKRHQRFASMRNDTDALIRAAPGPRPFRAAGAAPDRRRAPPDAGADADVSARRCLAEDKIAIRAAVSDHV